MKQIKSFHCEYCKLCSIKGEILYRGLKDIIGTIEGSWNIYKCPECHFLWLDPMPTKEDIHLAYVEYPTHSTCLKSDLSFKDRIKAGYLSWRYGYRNDKISAFDKLMGLFLYLVPIKRVSSDFWFKSLKDMKSKGRLLDIGCGGGDLVKLMQQWGWQAEGIEPDYMAVKNARLKGLKIHHGDFLEYDFKDNTFDAILSSHVFEHIFEPVDFLKKCYRILKPGGKLCIATPNADSWQHSYFKKSWMALDAPRHLYLFSPHSMKICAKGANIKHYSVSTTSRGSAFISSASFHIQKTGQYHWEDKVHIKSKILANIMEIGEYFALFFNKEKGVELLFTAYKDNDSKN